MNLNSFKSFSPITDSYTENVFDLSSIDELNAVCENASEAFEIYSKLSAKKRAKFLIEIADQIMGLGDKLIDTCIEETGLTRERVISERGRTCNQLRKFAEHITDGWYVNAVIDLAEPERTPVPKPDIRKMEVPIGVVAVFAASNFPLAFSTAGGDTASALAAGCCVVVKSHPSHPGTSELINSAIKSAIERRGLPDGVFNACQLNNDNAAALVKNPIIKAVGFTGSRSIGLLLTELANKRPEPIPVFAEMSSVNPVIVLPDALESNPQQVARNLSNSVCLSAGQFCTNPGLVLILSDEKTENFLTAFAEVFSQNLATPMLSRNISDAYHKNIARLKDTTGISILASGEADAKYRSINGTPVSFIVEGDVFLENVSLSEEVFGPATMVVKVRSQEMLLQILKRLEGQLTATIHTNGNKPDLVNSIIQVIRKKAGRLIFNGFPTGVEVCDAMHHSGPYPATNNSRYTSVGTGAIYRFLRPLAYQNFPEKYLPDELKNANPLKILRVVNGEWKVEAIQQ